MGLQMRGMIVKYVLHLAIFLDSKSHTCWYFYICIQVYKKWLLKTISDTWNLFHTKFTALWDKHKDGPGEAYLSEIYNNSELHLLVKEKYMEELFHDTLGFGAAKMIRFMIHFWCFICLR